MSNNEAYFVREYETLLANKTLKISQIEIGDVGGIVWDAAIVLGKYLEKEIVENRIQLKDNRNILELGAGTGIIGLILATHGGGANIILTDLNELLDLLRKNLDENKSLIHSTSTCEIKELNWMNHGDILKDFKKQNIIIIADCIYYEQSCEPLIKCLINLSDSNTTIFCSYEKRDMGKVPQIQNQFFELANKYFHVNLVDNKDLDEFYQSDDIFVYKMKIK